MARLRDGGGLCAALPFLTPAGLRCSRQRVAGGSTRAVGGVAVFTLLVVLWVTAAAAQVARGCRSSAFPDGAATAAWVVLAVCLGGCISFTTKSTGDFDFEERFEKATKEIVARSIQSEEAVLKEHRTSIDAKVEQFVRRHFVRADELVLAHTVAAQRALGGGFALFNDYARRRAALLKFTLTLRPSLEFIESTVANATAFPSGRILVNRPLAEAFDVNADGFDSVLLGILIHELLHVRDGHALEQWATADGRQAWATDKVIGALSKVTVLIPFLSVKYDVQYPLTFGATKQLPALSEYAADMGAVSLLDRAGYDSGRYIAFLLEMSSNTAESRPRNAPSLLRHRVECLGAFSRDRFEEELQGVRIGSTEAGDSIVQNLDLTVFYKLASQLDAPGVLARQFPGRPGMSDADRRSIVLTVIRKASYTGCAIRRSFPGVPLKQGALITPTFDLMMFTQHW